MEELMNDANPIADIESEATPDTHVAAASRRSMLRNLALGAAAAGAASVVVGGKSAGAANGQPLTLGVTNDHAAATNVNYNGAVTAASFNVQSGDQTAANDGILNGLFANQGTAFLGVASGNGNQNIGVTGWSKKANGTGVIGFTGGTGAYGGEFFGGLAEVRLRPGGAAPITLTSTHAVGEIYEDETGTMWVCVVAGAPGSWRELAGANTAGSFHAIAPRRVFDSRTTTKFAVAVDRDISVATATDSTPNVVPPFATAVALTVTVTETEGNGGFVAVRPQGTEYRGTSSINWFGANQNLATTVITGVGGDRLITVRAGSAATHVVVDVTGYYR
jgi:hypothetical protein